jgi:hypothetical protein
MPHYNASARNALMAAGLGMRVDRAADDVPHTTQEAIFDIVGGRVLMTGILGEVTVQLGAVGNLSLESNPTTGTTTAITNVVASNVNEVGTLISITGTVGDAMLCAAAGGVRMMTSPVVLPAGTLEFKASATAAGDVKWSIWYLPLDDGAYVTAAAVV